jgi:hypothetical protein
MVDTVVVAERDDEDTGYRFSWSLAIAGGVAATAVTFFLLMLGSGFGLLLVNPVTHSGPSLPAFLTGGAIYFFIAQAFGFAVGGHLSGRLLGPVVETQMQEDFRAGAHGLVAWAVTILATLAVIALAGLTAANTGATTAALYGSTMPHATNGAPAAYLVDNLFRPHDSAALFRSNVDAEARAEAGRILEAGLARGIQMTPDDRVRLIGLPSAEAGISRSEAAARVDRMQADVQAKARHDTDIARKAASYASLWIAFSLLFGAIVAVVSAIFARNEDDRESWVR